MTFLDKLNRQIDTANSLLCIGLDSNHSKLPAYVRDDPQALFVFNKAIIDATATTVCSYKLNSAFYEALGADGIAQLKLTTDYLCQKYPSIPIILDAKRGDIGNTNNDYAAFTFDYLGVDALTIHPYLGGEALEPFLEHKDKGLIVLCRTSNPGAGEFQDLSVEGRPLYEHVAQAVAKRWNTYSNCSLVVGATYPAEMKAIRQLVGPDMPFLVPGIGAQGGDLAAVMQAGIGAQGRGLIIHSAREIIFASSGKDFAEAAAAQATALQASINKYRT